MTCCQAALDQTVAQSQTILAIYQGAPLARLFRALRLLALHLFKQSAIPITVLPPSCDPCKPTEIPHCRPNTTGSFSTRPAGPPRSPRVLCQPCSSLMCEHPQLKKVLGRPRFQRVRMDMRAGAGHLLSKPIMRRALCVGASACSRSLGNHCCRAAPQTSTDRCRVKWSYFGQHSEQRSTSKGWRATRHRCRTWASCPHCSQASTLDLGSCTRK